MRLIDADKLKDAISTKDGVNYDSIMAEIDNAPTIMGFVHEDYDGLLYVDYKKVVIERTIDEDGETYQVFHIIGEAQNE